MAFKRSLKATNGATTSASQLTLRASIYPLCLVTVLFFLWGFSYGLLDTLNKHFQNSLGIDRARSAGLQAAYFGAYPLAALGHANWILRHYGYKAVFIWGLSLYGIGALVAWPCILHRSFGGFCAAIFIIGNGLGSLETAANPYITVCGPPKYSELRINLSQAFNGVGSVVAPLMGSYIFFKNVSGDAESLRNVQWVYLAIAAFVFLLAIVFYFSTIPEITDADLAEMANEVGGNNDHLPLRKQYRLFHAAFAQACYCGSQVAVASFFINYVVDTVPGSSSAYGAQLLAGAQGGFAIGRFLGVGLMKYIRPRKVFMGYMSMVIVFTAASIGARGNSAIAMVFIILFFESIVFPTIVALGMRGLGKHSKRGSGFIIGGVVGGAIVPPILGAVSDIKGSNTAYAFAVPLFFFILSWSYPFCVNFVPSYTKSADSVVTGVGRSASIDATAAAIIIEENDLDLKEKHIGTVETVAH